MEKLRFGQVEFELVPMGISEDVTSKTRSFVIVKNQDIDELRFTILDSINLIEHIGSDGEIIKSYMDCFVLKSIQVDYEEIESYKILLSTDTAFGEVRALQSQITSLQSELTSTKDELMLTQVTNDTAVAELTILIAMMLPTGQEEVTK